MSKVANEQTVTTVLHLSFNGAMENVRTYVMAHHEASIALVAASAVCMIVGAYHEDKAQRKSWDETKKVITETMTEQGYKKSSIASYIGTAKALCQSVLKNQTQGEFGGVVGDILKASKVAKAQDAMESYIRTVLKVGPKERASYQSLLGYLGLAQKATPSGTPNDNAAPGIPPVTAAKGAAANIVKRLETEPAILSSVPGDKLADAVMANNTVDRTSLLNKMLDGIESIETLEAVIAHAKQRIAAVKSFQKGLSDVIEGKDTKAATPKVAATA